MKQCKKCLEWKFCAEFYDAAGTRDGLRGECKTCNLAAKKDWYERNRDKAIAKAKSWQQENAEHVNAYRRKRNATRRNEIRSGHLRRKFGISLDDYDSMLAAQGGVCAICRRPPAEGKSLHVDHDHGTGVVRGLLCFTCNGGLGMLGEDEVILLFAFNYVVENGVDVELNTVARARVAALVAVGAGEGGN